MTRCASPERGRPSARHATTLAAYYTQRFLIVFSASTPLIDARRRRRLEHFHLLAHEYFHYWHNFSTVVGIKLFSRAQCLMAEFTRTLNPTLDGTADGMHAIPQAERGRCAELLRSIDNLEGDRGLDDSHLQASVRRVEMSAEIAFERHAQMPFYGAPIPSPRVLVPMDFGLEDGAIVRKEFEVGSYVIEEGIAYLVERAVEPFARRSVQPTNAPIVPYGILPAVVRGITSPDLNDFAIASIGTLALLETHPGPGLIDLCERMRDLLDAGLQQSAALEQLEEESKPTRDGNLARTRQTGAHELARHSGRGLSEDAVRHFCEQMNAAFDLRIADPLFDMKGVFLSGNPRRWLIHHMIAFPHCAILQQRKGPESRLLRDRFLNEQATTSTGLDVGACMRTLEAQQAFVYAHIAADRSGFIPSQDVTARCPFYTGCDLEQRRTNADVCGSKPWEGIGDHSTFCWYTAAIAGMQRPITLRPRPPSHP